MSCAASHNKIDQREMKWWNKADAKPTTKYSRCLNRNTWMVYTTTSISTRKSRFFLLPLSAQSVMVSVPFSFGPLFALENFKANASYTLPMTNWSEHKCGTRCIHTRCERARDGRIYKAAQRTVHLTTMNSCSFFFPPRFPFSFEHIFMVHRMVNMLLYVECEKMLQWDWQMQEKKNQLNMLIFCGPIWMPFFTQQFICTGLFVVSFFSLYLLKCFRRVYTAIKFKRYVIMFWHSQSSVHVEWRFFFLLISRTFSLAFWMQEKKWNHLLPDLKAFLICKIKQMKKAREFFDPIRALFIVIDGLCGQTPKFPTLMKGAHRKWRYRLLLLPLFASKIHIFLRVI